MNIDCPFCISRIGTRDTKKHLNVSFKKNLYHCFRCGAKPSLCGRLSMLNYDDSALKILCHTEEEKTKEILDLNIISKEIRENSLAHKYLLARGITDEEIIKYHMRVGIPYEQGKTLNRKWQNRIIIPYLVNDKCHYIVARSMDGRKPKYLNSSGQKTRIVYGIHHVSGQAILCEGIISSIAATRKTGIPALAMLGKTISDWQASTIARKCNRIYVCLDGGVDPSLVAKKLVNHGVEVYTVSLPNDSDPDELNSDILVKCLTNSKAFNYFKGLYEVKQNAT